MFIGVPNFLQVLVTFVRVGTFELISLANSHVDGYSTWSNEGSGRSRRNYGLTTPAGCFCRRSIRGASIPVTCPEVCNCCPSREIAIIDEMA
jgi:hypothetical protein